MFRQTYKPKLLSGEDAKKLWDLSAAVRDINSTALIERLDASGLVTTDEVRGKIFRLINAG